MGRSILAVIAGYLVTAILVVVKFAAMTSLIPGAAPKAGQLQFPSTGLQVVSLILDFASAILGGYVAAWIARRNQIQHALALGILMVLLGILSMSISRGSEPVWYQIALIVISIPGALLGGMLRARQRPAAGSAGAAA